VPKPNPQTDARSAPAADPAAAESSFQSGSAAADADGESDPRERPSLLAATPDADAVAERLRTLAALAGFSGLLVALITAELLVRI